MKLNQIILTSMFLDSECNSSLTILLQQQPVNKLILEQLT